MTAVCIAVNTTVQTVLAIGNPPSVMPGLSADSMDGAADHGQPTYSIFTCVQPLCHLPNADG